MAGMTAALRGAERPFPGPSWNRLGHVFLTDFPFPPLPFPPASLLPRAAFSATAGPYKAVCLSSVDDKKVELKMKKKKIMKKLVDSGFKSIDTYFLSSEVTQIFV